MVSIIIPLYNVEHYVIDSLKSVLSQTYSNIEFLLIDDCSTDSTMQIVEEYLLKHSRKDAVRIIHHDNNLGLSAARNTGLRNAHGEYVFFMDSDDEITLDCIEKHYNALDKENMAAFTIADLCLEGTKSVHIKPILDQVQNLPLETSYLRRMWNISACNKLYRKSFLEENGLIFQEGLLHEDILWSYKVAFQAAKAALVKEATYIYKIHQGSITTSQNSKRKIDSLVYILNILREDWNNGKIGLENSIDFIHFFDFWRFNTALLLLNYSGTKEEQKEYYRQISNMHIGKNADIYALLLNMPFFLFSSSIGSIYYLYKKMK